MGAVAAPELGATLEDLVSIAWTELATDGDTECPVCGGEMRCADEGVARCDDCGAELS
jgi:tRNA(Ile2) C34 agmatinyltransferase TiaS